MEDNTLDFFDLDGYESPVPDVEPAEPVEPAKDPEDVVEDDPIDEPIVPEPETPVTTTNLSLGISTSIFFKLCSRAPCITILSCGIYFPFIILF